jgi:hypothetical protein
MNGKGKGKGKKMATPQIISVTPSKTDLQPAEIFEVTVIASDPDAKTGEQTIVVKDSQGNTSVPVKVKLSISDPLTIHIQDTDGLGIKYTPHPTDPTKMIGQVPV